ncbi:MAG: GAF domain-containing protein [Alphaproteobacteria bacterium]|uniref:histidine kinase n=1 Tax=Candidatus Nitrobium versatile TaxID=2884831 RepID=A0A953SD81_9BACT|nr:GAF domain-containing protein [Candidatus Nitrobium versatile]
MHYNKEVHIREWIEHALATIVKLNNIIGYLPLHLDSTLKTIVEGTYQLFHPTLCLVYTLEDDQQLKLAAHIESDEAGGDIHLDSSVEACTALRYGLPYIAGSADIWSANVCSNIKVNSDTTISHICIPMVTGSERHGVLSVTFHPERVLSREELEVLLSIANQASAAIHRYRLFERLRNEKIGIERAYTEISDLNRQLEMKIVELNRTQDRLIQSEKQAAIGELSAGLCHEINNPISIILNRIECLKMEAKELELSASLMKDLDVIYSCAAKVSSTIQDLLIFSRHHSAETEEINLKGLIEGVIGMLQRDLQMNNCTVHLAVSPDTPYVYGDSDRLEQVFRNLVSNAIDAMPEGGDILIETERSLEREGVIIKVKDEGEGIPEENLHRIFDPFFTTKRLGKGSGLGLSICYGIVKNHGGDIRAQSTPMGGSTFSIYLPYKRKVG